MRELTLDMYIISRCTHNYYARELKKLHITMGQFPFVMGIAENDGISQENLSFNVRISKSMTAAIVQQLLNAGMITREVDQADRRNYKLHATRKTLELIPKIHRVIDHCHREILADLSDIERDAFTRLTRKVRTRTEFAFGKKRTEKKSRPFSHRE